MTGTRALNYLPPIVGFSQPPPCPTCDLTALFGTGLKIDSAASDGTSGLGASGNPESHLTRGLRSEFMHVLIIVDSNAVARYSLRSLSDYIALLALTRITSPDSCGGLSSIVNLFVADCAEAPMAMTPADTAYLKALYAADLDMNLNIERGDLHERMLQVISGASSTVFYFLGFSNNSTNPPTSGSRIMTARVPLPMVTIPGSDTTLARAASARFRSASSLSTSNPT